MMVFMSLVVVWIGKFCRDVVGRLNVNVAVIVTVNCMFYAWCSVWVLLLYVLCCSMHVLCCSFSVWCSVLGVIVICSVLFFVCQFGVLLLYVLCCSMYIYWYCILGVVVGTVCAVFAVQCMQRYFMDNLPNAVRLSSFSFSLDV